MALHNLSNRIGGINPGVFNYHPVTYCAELERVIAVAKNKGYGLPTPYQLRILNWYIQELKSNGLWSKKDIAYVSQYGSLHEVPSDWRNYTSPSLYQLNNITNFTKLNLKNPLSFEADYILDTVISRFRITNTKRGLLKSSTTVNNYIDIAWNPSTNGVNWTLNDAGIIWYCDGVFDATNGSTTNSGIVRNSAGDTSLSVNPWTGINSRIAAINGTGGSFGGGVSTQAGFHVVQRTDSNALAWYRNNAAYGTRTDASSAVPNVTLQLMTRYSSSCGMFSFGGSYTAEQRTTEYDLWNQYKSKLGII